MSTEAPYFLSAVAVGLGATLFMDLWALFLKRVFGIASADYCLVGRWFCHMPEGTFMHASIANASQKRFECTVGWIAQLNEMIGDPEYKIGRPRQLYAGAARRDVRPIAQLNEMIGDPEYKIGRPRQLYAGSARRDVKALAQR